MTRVLDLFAGCGGLSHGLEQSGFEVIAANDIAEAAAETHQRNHKNSKFFLGSITDVDLRNELVAFARDGGCEIVVGGPPCQAYSLAGRRDVDDARGHLFEDYVTVVDELRPKFFVMENVKGILSMRHDRVNLKPSEQKQLDHIKDLEKEQIQLRLQRKQSKNTERIKFESIDDLRLSAINAELTRLKRLAISLRESVPDRIVARFAELGYKVEYRLLNAADYGVPQRRERVIFIGTRLMVPILFPRTTHRDPSGSADLFSSLPPWISTGEAIADLELREQDVSWSHEFTSHRPDFVERLRKTPIGGSVYEGFSDAWYRQPADEPSRTVKENHGGVFVHYAQPRVLTPRELARLQSFPDDFLFCGSKSKVLVQIGNAVPPRLGRAIGSALKEMMELAALQEASEPKRRAGRKKTA